MIDIDLELSTNVASRVDAAGWSEALLIVDEPHTGAAANTLLACGAPGSNPDASGNCAITSTGDRAATYNGTAAHPNVFQARRVASNRLQWSSVPFDPPGPGLTRVFRVVNVRENAALQTRPANPALPNQTTALISFSGAGAPSLSNPLQVVAFTEAQSAPGGGGVSVAPATAVALSQCSAYNPGLAADPASSGTVTPQFSVSLTEEHAANFKVKNIAQENANQPNGPAQAPIATDYPQDQRQNIPGFVFDTETGFLNNGDNLPFDSSPAIAFPAVNGLDRAGSADQGTRLYVKFSGIPNGMRLFTPITLDILKADSSHAKSGIAVLVATDGNGAGAYSRVADTASHYAPLQAGDIAVYEVLGANSSAIEVLTIPIAAAHDPNISTPPGDAQITLTAGFAPLSVVTESDATAPIPRFMDAWTAATPPTAFDITGCRPPDLTLAMSAVGTFTQSSSAAFTLTVKNTGTKPATGTVTVSDTLPTGLTATSMAGTGWTCTPATVSCSRPAIDADALAGGASYPPITLNVAVAANASASVVNTATVSGGSDADATNNTASATVAVQNGAKRRTTFTTSPAGLPYQIDGVEYTGIHAFDWLVGSSHTIAVAATIDGASGTRYAFQNWSDSGALSHSVTPANTTAVTYTASFGTQYQLTTNVAPIAAGRVEPAAPAYHAAGTTVTLAAWSNPGFRFVTWVGAVQNPASAVTTILMDGPKSVTANFASPAPQWINFDSIPNKTFGSAPFQATATSTSGLPVAFAVVSGPATIQGNLVTLTGPGTVSIVASQPGNGTYAAAEAVIRTFEVLPAPPRSSASITNVVDSAAYTSRTIASGSLVSVLGTSLALETASAGSNGPANSLGHSVVTITDSKGVMRTAGLLYVSHAQINLVAPEGLAAGAATLTVHNGAGESVSTAITVVAVAPTLFSADMTGKGLAAANQLHVSADGTQRWAAVAGCSPGGCGPMPIEFGSDESVYLILYGTGFRGRSTLDAVTAQIGGIACEVLYVGSQGQYPGLDQVNIRLPHALAGRGLVDVVLSVDGHQTNALQVAMK